MDKKDVTAATVIGTRTWCISGREHAVILQQARSNHIFWLNGLQSWEPHHDFHDHSDFHFPTSTLVACP
jgi:hypothetical protein